MGEIGMLSVGKVVERIIENKYLIFAILCAVFGLAMPFIPIKFFSICSTNYSELGSSGDWINGWSMPGMSFASFMLMYSAYRLQNEDLKLTRKEMKETNEHLKNQKKENFIFHLFSIHHDIVSGFADVVNIPKFKIDDETRFRKLSDDSEIVYKRGVICIEGVWNKLFNKYVSKIEGRSKIEIQGKDKSIVESLYKDWYAYEKMRFANYYENLEFILKYIKMANQENSITDYRLYFELFYSQLSSSEKSLLFYYSIFCKSNEVYNILKQTGFYELSGYDLLSAEHKNWVM